MLTNEEARALKVLVRDLGGKTVSGISQENLLNAIERATDTYETNDVIARGPNINSTNMLNDAARALGWRTDFATGDSPITWELVLDGIRKLKVLESFRFTPEEIKWLAEIVLEKASPEKGNPYKRILFKILGDT